VLYGILGDIHANLPALEAVLEAFDDHDVDRVLCLGDIVGYGAQAAECIERVRALQPILVGGNHDWGVGGRLSLNYFNKAAAEAIVWTRKVLSEETRRWLAELPLVQRVGDKCTIAHSTLHEPERFDYIFTAYDAYLSFRHLTTPVGFVGHSHVPVTFFDGDPIRFSTAEVQNLGARRAICNVGSVGQPRDENPLAAFGLYESETAHLRVLRIPYDVDAAARAILDAGLPPINAARLRVGR
jgi:diadenosine tetraphosphatase ApaH/serine/threonine PP2A family protein phosphatase